RVQGGTEVWQEEGARVDPGARLVGPVYLGRGTVVEAGAEVGPYAVLGEYCLVRSGASVRRSILWSRTVVDRGAELRGVVAADGVRFKARSAAFEGAVLGSRACVEEEATVRPQVKVWPYKQVGEGVTLSSSLVWGERAPRHLFGLRGVSGLANVELTPELVVRLGAAFAALLPAGSWLGVSADHSSAARLLKGALVSGLLSAGAQVCDLGLLPSPAARFAIPSLSLKGGVHLRQVEEVGRVLVEFLDEQGLTLERGRQRALENLYYREDFGRVSGGAIGEVTCRAEGMERYLQALVASVDRAALLSAGLKVAAAAVPLSLEPVLPQLLGQLGCRIQPAPPTLAGVAEAVRAGRCQVGFLVDEDGERLWLVDEGAQVVRQELLLPLAALLALRRFRTAAVPVTASQAVETLAEHLGGRVIRTKASLRAVLEPLRAKVAGGALPSSFDALATAVFLLEALAQEKRALTKLLAEIPEFHQAKAAVPCPWEAKGWVMRALLGQLKGQRVELTDGVKVFHDEGWALVLPDAELPRFNVWGEGRTQEEAQRLVSDYAGRIASFLGALCASEEAQSR
ncbi:MAG: nucleotidyltransferase, partial [Bacillota bacterium]|nr:nucleotidyltransferase [Bacillota bacterium]